MTTISLQIFLYYVFMFFHCLIFVFYLKRSSLNYPIDFTAYFFSFPNCQDSTLLGSELSS